MRSLLMYIFAAMILLALCLVVKDAIGAERNFSWTPNEDEATGYNLYWGYESGVYAGIQDAGFPDPVDGRIHGTLDNLPEEDRTLFFAATAYDDRGDEVLESDYSIELSDFIAAPPIVRPQPPQDVRAEFIE